MSKPTKPKATARVSKKPARLDGLVNAVTGLGVLGRDKRTSASYRLSALVDKDAEILWRDNDMAGVIVEKPVEEMLREGFRLEGLDKEEDSELLVGLLDDLDFSATVAQALLWERAFRGGAVLIGANDGGKPDQELVLENVRSVDFLTPFRARELVACDWYEDPLAPKYGWPKTYWIQPDSGFAGTARMIKVHESRLIKFPGMVMTKEQLRSQQGWGDSVLQRCHEIIRDFDMTWGSAGVLMQDFSQAIVKLSGLAQALSMDDDGAVRARLENMDYARSVLRAMVIDGEDSFERSPTPMSGMPEMLDRFSNRLAGAAQMPVSLLFGQSPAGLNATGDADIRYWYARVSAMQRKKLGPAIERLVRILMIVEGIAEPDNWSVVFNPLWAPTELEGAQARLTQAQTDDLYIANGTITPEEVAHSRFANGRWSPQTIVDMGLREQLALDNPMSDTNKPEPVVPFGAPFGGAPPADPEEEDEDDATDQ